MKISTAAKEYLIEIEVRKFTPKTIRSYRNNLNLFLRFCEEQAHVTDVEDLSLAVVRQFSLYMSSRGRKGSYINGHPREYKRKILKFAKRLAYIYRYIYNWVCEQSIRVDCRTLFIFWEENKMRIILDTDKKTITVPWNYA